MQTIDDNNYELWLLRYAEGELTASEREAVEAWLQQHPDAADELALYNEAPRLEATTITMNGFRHPAFKARNAAWIRWTAAAAIVVALMMPALRTGVMGHIEEVPSAPLVAEATPVALEEPQPVMSHRPRTLHKPVKAAIPIEDTVSYAPEQVEAIAVMAEVEAHQSSSLIAFEPEEPLPDTLSSYTLIAFERSTGWGDRLLALEESVSVSFRAKIDNIINIIK